MIPFNASRGTNQVVSPAAVSASISINKADTSVRLVNSGANICYVRIGEGVHTATTADIPVRSAESVIVGKGLGEGTVAYISAAGTTLNIQTGIGGI
jgi:hypothetical protein